jgi:N-lysine methyltransferase SETD6
LADTISKFSALIAMDEKYSKFVSWARSNGAIIPDTLTFPSNDGEASVQTTIPVEKGTQLFHLPHSILITQAKCASCLPQLAPFSVHEKICAFVANERHCNEFWKPYFECLPCQFTTPPYFTEDELTVLEGTNLSHAWKDHISLWMEEYGRVKKVLNGMTWY